MIFALFIVPHLKQASAKAVQGLKDVSIFSGSLDVVGISLSVEVDHFVPSGPVSIIV